MSAINKIQRVSFHEKVNDSLKELIINGTWKTGEKLPAEQQLADMFSVSRPTIRIALQGLIAQGIIEKRNGAAYIKEFDMGDYIGRVSNMVMNPRMLSDVFEFRNYIELRCAHLAMMHCSEGDFAILEKINDRLNEFEYSFSLDNSDVIKAHAEVDFSFHEALCALSGNALYQLAFSSAKAPITYYLQAILTKRLEKFHENHPEIEKIRMEDIVEKKPHRLIVEALKRKDFAYFETLYSLHSDYLFIE